MLNVIFRVQYIIRICCLRNILMKNIEKLKILRDKTPDTIFEEENIFDNASKYLKKI